MNVVVQNLLLVRGFDVVCVIPFLPPRKTHRGCHCHDKGLGGDDGTSFQCQIIQHHPRPPNCTALSYTRTSAGYIFSVRVQYQYHQFNSSMRTAAEALAN